MTRLIVSPKTLAAEAEGRLPKNFGIGRLCSASVILWLEMGQNQQLPLRYRSKATGDWTEYLVPESSIKFRMYLL